MLWIIPAFVSAIGVALQSVYIKKNTFHFNEMIVTWSVLAFSSILYLPLLFISNKPDLSTTFWIAVIARLFIDSIGFTFYIKGLKEAPISLVMPMVSIVPILLIIVSFIINHLFPTPLGILGIIITVFGIYYLNFDHDTKNILSPFIALKNNRGVQYVLIFAVSQAFVTSLAKLGIDKSNLLFYTSFYQLFWAVCFLPVAYFANPKEFRSIFNVRDLKRLFPVGGLDALQVLAQNIAFVLTLPVYVQSVQNTSILFASFFGWYFFKEKLEKHVIPTILIVAGIILLTIVQK